MKQCEPCFEPPDNCEGLFTDGETPGLPYSDAVFYEMNKLAEEFDVAAPFVFGRSVMGKPLLYMCAGIGPRKVLYSASHHANEWITTLVLLKFMKELFKSAKANGLIGTFYAEDLLNKTTLYFAPLINPDGVDLVLGKISSGKYFEQAKKIASNYPSVSFPSGWKANIEGTDLNLQYPANWEKAKQIKSNLGYSGPAPRDYVGTAPLSAPESRALANFLRNINPELVLALHSQGNEIYWKFADCEPAGAFELGQRLAQASGYKLSQTPPESDNAGFKDWFIQDFGRPGYTVEMGLGESPLPLSQFETIYAGMEPLLASAANG